MAINLSPLASKKCRQFFFSFVRSFVHQFLNTQFEKFSFESIGKRKKMFICCWSTESNCNGELVKDYARYTTTQHIHFPELKKTKIAAVALRRLQSTEFVNRGNRFASNFVFVSFVKTANKSFQSETEIDFFFFFFVHSCGCTKLWARAWESEKSGDWEKRSVREWKSELHITKHSRKIQAFVENTLVKSAAFRLFFFPLLPRLLLLLLLLEHMQF